MWYLRPSGTACAEEILYGSKKKLIASDPGHYVDGRIQKADPIDGESASENYYLVVEADGFTSYFDGDTTIGKKILQKCKLGELCRLKIGIEKNWEHNVNHATFWIVKLVGNPSKLADETIRLDESLRYRDGFVSVDLSNYEGRPEGYFTSDRFPEVTLRITHCKIEGDHFTFDVGLQISPEASVSKRLAQIRSAPQTTTETIETCFSDICTRYRYKADEYFGGISASVKMSRKTLVGSRSIELIFEGDADAPQFSYKFDIPRAIGKLCSKD